MEKSEQDSFLSDLEVKTDVLDEPLIADEVIKTEAEETDEEKGKAKNRRERRLLQQNQQLREEAIAASSRAQALSEVTKFQAEAGNDHLKEVEAIFGTDTPEKLAATNILKKALSGMSDSAVQKALEKVDERRANETQAVAKEERELDTLLDTVEDEHGINMGEEAERKGFLTLLEKLSPKDKDGNIIAYADPDTTAEIYLSRKEKTSSRAKDLASRSMTHSGASQDSKLQEDATWKALKDLGIF